MNFQSSGLSVSSCSINLCGRQKHFVRWARERALQLIFLFLSFVAVNLQANGRQLCKNPEEHYCLVKKKRITRAVSEAKTFVVSTPSQMAA